MSSVTVAERGGGLGFSKLLVLGLLVFTCYAVISNGTRHATRTHTEAPTLRFQHENGLCQQKEAYVSLRRGTLLVLCQTQDGQWGGIVWKVLEFRNENTQLMAQGDMYECTAFVSSRSYWDRVIARDGYVKAGDTQWYGSLLWLIWP